MVALESTILAHGLPAPANRAAADAIEAAVRAHGAVPATVAVLDGHARVGLSAAELDRVCGGGLAKLSARDLGVAVALGRDGATTVAATAALAHAVGVPLFATGGLGGVHRGARETWDVSADLDALARTAVLVVCSGVKSILDVPATLEVLETASVPVLGYRTDTLPRLLPADAGLPVPWRVEHPGAGRRRVWRAPGPRWACRPARWCSPSPCPPDEQPADVHDRRSPKGSRWWRARGHREGRDPTLLAHFHEGSGGASLATNLALVVANAALAAQVAVALAAVRPPPA